jgi:Icc protein
MNHVANNGAVESEASSPPVHELPNARLVQISDPHLLSDKHDTHRTVNTSTSFERVLAGAQSLIRDADAVLLTGDVAQDETSATYARLSHSWVEEWVGSHTPVWCLPGNHDAPVLMQAALNALPFRFLGHHTLGNWEIILLDSRNPGKASGLLGEQELGRLKSRLSNTQAEHTLVVLHHHPVPLGSSWLDSVGLEDRDAFEQVITGSNVRAVVFGHIHQVVDRTINGIRYLGCPSTCVQFTPNQITFGLDQRPPGFRTLLLYPSGSVKTDVVWVRNVLPGEDAKHTESGAA